MNLFSPVKSFLAISLLFTSFYGFAHIEECPEKTLEADNELRVTVLEICNFFKNFSIGNSCSPSTLELDVANQCQGTIRANIYVVNLENYPIPGTNLFNLPPGVPGMHLNIVDDYSNSYNSSTADVFEQTNIIVTGKNGKDYKVYRATAIVTIDVTNFCDPGSGTPGTLTNIPLKVTLMNSSNNSIYPIWDNFGDEDIFPCAVYNETCAFCSGAPNCPANSGAPIYEEVACGSCGPCEGSNYSIPTVANPAGELKQNHEKKTPTAIDESDNANEISFSVSPNPFKDQLNISYQIEKATDFIIEIINLQGRVVHQEKRKGQKGNNEINLNTNNIPEGILYCRIKTPTKNFIKKIVKLN